MTFKYFCFDLLLLSSLSGLGYLSKNPISNIISIPLIAVLMFRNFSMMHEAVHGATLNGKAKLNTFIGIFCGALCMLPYEPWKKIHLDHHYWSGNIDQDPAMSLIKAFPKWPSPLRTFCNALWKFWVPILSVLQYGVFWVHSAKHLWNNKSSFKFAASILLPSIIWGLILYFSPASFVMYSLLPGIILYLLLVEVVNFPHHLELPVIENEQRLKLWDQHKTARSCLYPNWISKYIVLNFNFHIEHHLFPKVPWYHLKRLHILTSDELRHEYNTDPQFAWIIKNRPKNIEDVLSAPAHQPVSETQAA